MSPADSVKKRHQNPGKSRERAKNKILEFQDDILGPFSYDKPSEVTKVYWIVAGRKKGRYPDPTPFNGKWLAFAPLEKIDETWAKIKKATEDGLLGSSSKVSTARENPNAPNRRTKVVCVYTYDCRDETDLRRIREALRSIGITQRIPYKTDMDTIEGKYVVRGDRRISKYYE